MNALFSKNNAPIAAVTAPASNSSGVFSSLKNPIFAGILVLVFFVILYIYHKKIGYYVSLGWNRMRGMMGYKTQLDIEMGPGAPGENPLLTASVYPDMTSTSDSGSLGSAGAGLAAERPFEARPSPPMLPPDERPSGMPGASTPSLSASLFGELNNPIGSQKEVFNVSRNIYTFHDAAAVCAAAGAELATYDQVKEAYENGADWCNYGWTKGQMAVYPTQKETYEKLQKGAPQYRNACGQPGVNGGYFDNPDLRFGVNCYGIKPAKKASDELLESQVALPPSPEEIEFDKQVQKFREQMDAATILPFRKGRWSE